MKPKSNPFLSRLALAGMSFAIGASAQADMLDLNGSTAGFGVADATTYDWHAALAWVPQATADDSGTGSGHATWVNGSRQAFFVGAGTGTSYTVRLGATGATAATLQNFALNVNALTTGPLAGAEGNVTIGDPGDTGVLSLNASNSVGAYGGTLTVNNPLSMGANRQINFRGGNVVINGAVSGTGTSRVLFGAGAFGLTSGTLTLGNSANTYSGRTNADYITAGYTLAVTKIADGGLNSSIGTSSANIGINGGTLKYIGNTGAQSTNLGLHVASAGAFVSADGTTSSDTISITGAPTYSATNSARTITLTGDNLGNNTMGFVFSNNGSGVNVLNKTGAGRWVVNQSNGYTGGTNAQNGTLVAANTAAFGVAGRTVNVGFNTSVGAVEFATDTTVNAYVLNVSSGYTGTVVVNRASTGTDMTHMMGTSTLGNGTLNIQKGANVTGTGTLEFSAINLSAGVTGLSTGTMLNPTTANVLVSGSINRTGVSANLLTLDGTSSGNLISGVISGVQALTKSNTSTWELSNSNTYTGTTRVAGGMLKLTNNLAIQSSAFDTSGAGTLDISTLTTPTFGGLIGDAGTGQDLVLPSGVTGLTLNVGAGVTQTYVKNISRTGGGAGLTLTKSGSSTQVLGGTNSYTGLTTVSGGELQITNSAAIGGTDVTVATGAQLTLNGSITVSGKTLTTSGSGRASGTGAFFGGLQSVSGTNEWAGNVILGADLSRIGARKDATLVVSGGIDDGLNTFGFVVRNESFGAGRNGAGNANTVTVLSGVSTYGGNTQLIHGLTKLDGGDNRLPIGTVLQFGLATTNAKFDMNGRNQEVAGLAVTSASTDANRDWNANELTNSSATLSTLTVNTATDQAFGGNLTNNVGIITGNIALQKSGSAKLTLSGANTYSGSTLVSAGTLFVTGSLTSNVTVGDSATMGGGGSVGDISFGGGSFLDIALALSVVPDLLTTGAISFAAAGFGVDNLVFNGAAVDWSTVANGTYTLLTGTLNSANLDNFGLANAYNLGGGRSAYFQSGSLQLVVIPEPNAAALLATLGSLILLRRRRED